MTLRLPAGRLALIAAVGPVLAGCAAPLLAPDTPRVVRGVTLLPYASHEECARMDEDDRLLWSFEAEAPLNFSISYRDGNAVLIPVARDGVQGDSGIYRAVRAEEYCATWEAGAEGTLLDYRLRLQKGGR